jgi:hypothetical protein
MSVSKFEKRYIGHMMIHLQFDQSSEIVLLVPTFGGKVQFKIIRNLLMPFTPA